MASRVQSSGSGTQLPLITEGQGLVSPPPATRSPNSKEQAALWAADVRHSIEDSIRNREEINETDIFLLRQELLPLVIAALQKDSHPAWQLLREAVLLIEPYASQLSMGPQLVHYLERLHSHLLAHQERLFDLQVIEALTRVFPQEMSTIKSNNSGPKNDYSYPTPTPSLSRSQPSPAKTAISHRLMLLPNGKNPYQLRADEEKKIKPKGLTFGDLRMSLPDVAMEMATREAIWTACMGNTAQALNIDLMEEDEMDLSPAASPERSLAASVDDEQEEEEISTSRTTERDSPVGPLDGRSAVEYFTKCLHTGKIKFMYFNHAPSRHYEPYNIISVAKNKVAKEHYVFSTFGVLHVYPDQPSENMTLAEWQREAVLFKAVSVIPFFKMFLLRKQFHRWYHKVRFAEFCRTRREICSQLLPAVPSYGAALLQASQLCQELMKLRIFPQEENKCYQLPEFENAVFYLNMQADKVLDRFFRYMRVIVETTAQELVHKVKHCEEQVRRKPVFTKDSLHLQRVKREQREENLQQAQHELNRLTAFVRLIDHMVLSRLVMLARDTVAGFVSDTMAVALNKEREALFQARLVFSSKDYLVMSPSKERFSRMIFRMVDELPKLITAGSETLEDESVIANSPPCTETVPPTPAPTGKISVCVSRRASTMSHMRHLSRPTASGAISTQAPSAEPPMEMRLQANRDAASEAAKLLPSPDLLQPDIPSKDEDTLGQATPRMVRTRRGRQADNASNSGIHSYRSLSRANFEEKLHNDIAYQAALRKQKTLLQEAIEEINEYCEKNAWLVDINKFCKQWNDTSVLQWRNAAAFTIEQKLNELRQWTDRVRNVDKVYITDNGIFSLDCSNLHETLIPRLNSILRELCTFVSDESVRLAKTFCKEIHAALANLKKQDTSIGGFAIYAGHISTYKKAMPHHQQSVEYIKSLFEVIRMSYRQLTPEEEKLDESVWNSWEAFLFQMQASMDFVNTQTPLLNQDLEEQYHLAEEQGTLDTQPSTDTAAEASLNPLEFLRLEQRAYELFQETSSGKFLDPNQNPTDILEEMTRIRDEFYSVQSQMTQASAWKQAITGEPYELDYLHQMAVQMDIRQELWKYIEVSTHEIADWKRQLFRKMNVRKALDKVTEWQAAAGQIKSHLPQADDVLRLWYKQLTDFKQELPYLHKLSHEALKPRHWKAIFVGMGEQLDLSHDFLVEELLSYNLSTHGHVIINEYRAAIAEQTIEQELNKLEKTWEDREVKLAKHILDSVYKEENRAAARAGDKKLKRMDKGRTEKEDNSSRNKSLESGDDLFVLIEIEELEYMLEDSVVSLQRMLSSPYLADHKQVAMRWHQDLQQIQEILDIWHTAQKKWRFLLKVFEEPDMYRRYEFLGNQFEAIHEEFKEFMLVVLADPKVTSLLNKSRNDKSHRSLQGDRLRDMLYTLVENEEAIIKHLSQILEKARSDFPRLYFLSDDELIQMLSVSRNPPALVPFVQKCFTGIENITFTLPSGTGAIGTSLDVALNVHKLEGSAVHGDLGESMVLFHPLAATPQATHWLAQLEHHMKVTVNSALEACVQARLDEACSQPLQILEELSILEAMAPENKTTTHLASEIKARYGHWLLHFPAQCVLVAEAILWERAVLKAITGKNKEELKALSAGLTTRIEQYSSVLQDNVAYVQIQNEDQARLRLHFLLGSLIAQTSYQRDITKGLADVDGVTEVCFDWMRVLKYHMEIQSVLQAKLDPTVRASLDMAGHMEERPASDEGPRRLTEVLPPIQRSKTTVTTGYQFGRCVVTQLAGVFAYDCEYLGPAHSTVLTPLTERAYLSLTMAMQKYQPGFLLGPPGTGKSTTTYDLARAMGRHLVVVNCSAELTMGVVSNVLTGALQSGCWTLLDDINRIPHGLNSVLAQQLEGISHAMQVLDTSQEHQYGLRGQPHTDKRITKSGQRIRRNSLTTLHSLPASIKGGPGITRQATVPHGFNESGLNTYFEDTWVEERDRRHSIEKEVDIRESEFYKAHRPPPLFYEFVTQHRRPKANYNDMFSNYKDYSPTYVGSILYNGKLVRANANYACFMTMTTTKGINTELPQNLRLTLRPCAMVTPDTSVIIEMFLFMAGFSQHTVWAGKLYVFFKTLKLQLLKEANYDLGIKAVVFVLRVAARNLQQILMIDMCMELRRSQKDASSSRSSSATEIRPTLERKASSRGVDEISPEESAILKALSIVLLPKMASQNDSAIFRSVLRDVFPKSSRPKSATMGCPKELMDEIEEQLSHENLYSTPNLIEKILLLQAAVKARQGVIILGPAGAGKTTCYQVLAKALTSLCYGKPVEEKDEDLKSERSLGFMYTQKLKVLKDSEQREAAKEQPKRWQRAKAKGSLISKVLNSFMSISEEESKAKASLLEADRYPKIEVEVVYPNVHTTQELYGHYDDGQWEEGLLTKLLQRSHDQVLAAEWCARNLDEKRGGKTPAQPPAPIHKWLVLDGSLNPVWAEGLHTLMDNTRKLYTADGGHVSLHSATTLLFEMTDLRDASPSIISHCPIVCVDMETVGWKSLWETWGQMARQRWVINPGCWQVLTLLANNLFPATLTFLKSECKSVFEHGVCSNRDGNSEGMVEVASFLRILSALLDRHLLREEVEKTHSAVVATDAAHGSPNCPKTPASESGKRSTMTMASSRLEDFIPHYMPTVRSLFAFAYGWGFGGHLHDDYRDKFCNFIRDLLLKAPQPISLPEGATIFDVCLEMKTGCLMRWADKPLEKARGPPHYVVVPEVDRYNYLIDLLVTSHVPVLLTGQPGVGKTSLVEYMVSGRRPFTRVVVSPGMVTSSLHDAICSHVAFLHESRQMAKVLPGKLAPKNTGSLLFFLDDLSAAPKQPGTDAKSLHELLRQILCQHGAYHQKRKVFTPLNEIDFIATATTPSAPDSGQGFSTHALCSRLWRHFTTFNMFLPNHAVLQSIFGSTVQSWLEEFPASAVEHHYEMGRALVQATLDIYGAIREQLKPTPSTPQYMFSLHDLAKVVEGMLLMSPRSKIKVAPKLKKPPKKSMQKRTSSVGDHADQRLNSVTPGSDISTAEPLPGMRIIARLWCHEITRVFGDRIIDEQDLSWFQSLVYDKVVQYLCTGTEEAPEKMSTILEDAQSHSSLPAADDPSVGPTTSAPPSRATIHSIASSSCDNDREPDRTTTDDALIPAPSSCYTAKLEESMNKDETKDNASMKFTPKPPPEPKPKSAEKPAVRLKSQPTPKAEKPKKTAASSATPRTGATTKTTTTGSDDEDDDEEEEETESETDTTTETESDSEGSEHTPSPFTATGRAKSMDHESRMSQAKVDRSMGSSASGYESKPLSPGNTQSSLRRTSVSKASSRRGVSFKVGLLADRVAERYYGPLLNIDQIRDPEEKLTEVLFSKYILSTHAEMQGLKIERGYLESTPIRLSIALESCVTSYNQATGQNLDLVFFKEATQHMARLTRVMATAHGHAVLLGTDYCTGRSTLVRLAGHLANCRIFTAAQQPTAIGCRLAAHEAMKRCSRLAAVSGRQVVLLIKDDLGPEVMQDICAFMKEGQCPGLYTEADIQNLATQMTPGQVKTTRVDKVEAAFNKFLSRVRQNLHIVVCLQYRDVKAHQGVPVLSQQLCRYPTLLQHCCCVDVYQPWTHEAYVTVAHKWLRRPSRFHVPWNVDHKTEQQHQIAMAMAYIHRSSKLALEGLHCHQSKEHKVFTPLTFKEYIHVFKVIAAYISKLELAKKEKYEAALHRINEAFATIAEYRGKVDELVPQHTQALAVVTGHVDFVEKHRQQYIEALDRCKLQEEKIESMSVPLTELRQDAQAEFDKVNPIYHAAVEMVKNLSNNNFCAIRSYRNPPAGVIKVMDAILVMLREPIGWENAKAVLMRPNLFKELEFYDKDNMPEDIFVALADYVFDPEFEPDKMRNSSMEASGMCCWVRAVYRYAEIVRYMAPKLQKLGEAEAELNEAQELLGEKRVAANQIKLALENKIQAHRQAVLEAKAIDKQIQGLERQISKASNLMSHMSEQHLSWKTELRLSRNKLRTAPGDALLTAAAICYHGALDNGTRAELMQDWLARCEIGNFDPEFEFSDPMRYVVTGPEDIGLHLNYVPSHQSLHLDGISESPVSGEAGSEPESDRPFSRGSQHQAAVYHHRPSIYDLGMTPRLELQRVSKPSISEGTLLSARTDLLARREDFALQNVLSEFDEYSLWHESGLPTDICSLHNALIMRTAAQVCPQSWPLLIDPDGHAEHWLRTLQGSVHGVDPSQLETDVEEEDGDLMDADALETGYETEPFSRTATATTDWDDHTTSRDSDIMTPQTGRMTGDDPPLANYLNNHQRSTSTEEIKVQPLTERPPDNLWVVAADDPALQDSMLTALVHGVVLLVTHLERQGIPDLLQPILYKQRQTREGSEGSQGISYTVTLGDTQLQWHPDFRLYLSTSVPTFLQGTGLSPVPIQMMTLVTMATSQEGMVNQVLHDIMQVERPEFQAQKHSSDADSLQHLRDLKQEQATILTLTLNLKVPLLSYTDMMSSLQHCQTATNHNRVILEEAYYLRRQLEDKRMYYIPVAVHAAKLYELMSRVCQLKVMYHVTLEMYMKMVQGVLKARHRGKGTQGCPKARAQELMSAITQATYQFMANMMVAADTQVFALLLVLERLHGNSQLTNQELGLFINGLDSSDLPDLPLDERVSWMSMSTWRSCAGLELALPCFRGLRQSLIKHADYWQEYFKCEVFLHSPVPDDKLTLTTFQKCILWKFCCPDKLQAVCHDLITIELGGVTAKGSQPELEQMYDYSANTRPIVITLPNGTTGIPRSSAVQEVYGLARQHAMDTKLHVVTCGIPGQLRELEGLIQDCMAQGYWLVINNAHLIEDWSQDFLKLLQMIVNSNQKKHGSDHSLLSSPSRDTTQVSITLTDVDAVTIHEDFRLWIITHMEGGTLLPGYVIQHSVKLAYEDVQDFGVRLKQTQDTVAMLTAKQEDAMRAVYKLYKDMDALALLSIIHVVLLHRHGYGGAALSNPCGWSGRDLEVTLQQMCAVAEVCDDPRSVMELAGHVYGSHCLDMGDRNVVMGVVKTLAKLWKNADQLSDSSTGLETLIKALVDHEQENMAAGLEGLGDLDSRLFDLGVIAQDELGAAGSKTLVQTLLNVLGASELISQPLESACQRAETNLLLIQEIFSNLPELPATKADGFYPVQIFYHGEITLLQAQIQMIRSQIQLLLKISQGCLPMDDHCREILVTLSQSKVPKAWLTQTFPSCPDLIQWARGFHRRIEVMTEYIQTKQDETVCFDLAAFGRPDRFLHCVMQTFARKQFKDLYKCCMEVQVLPSGQIPDKAPMTGAYVQNLQLHNATWDDSLGILTELPATSSAPTIIPYVWLKPMDPTSFTARSSAKVKQKPKYACPLYAASRSDALDVRYRVGILALPTDMPVELWAEKRVHLACTPLV